MSPFDLLAAVIRLSLLMSLFVAALQASLGTIGLLIWLRS